MSRTGSGARGDSPEAEASGERPGAGVWSRPPGFRGTQTTAMIIQELLEIQERRGYLPAAELEALSARLGVPLHRLHEVASCYPHYRLTPPPRVDVRVCRDMACHLRGAIQTIQNLEALGAEIGGGQVEVGGVSCLGQCDAAPAVVIDHHIYRGKTIAECRALVREAVHGRERPGTAVTAAPPAPESD